MTPIRGLGNLLIRAAFRLLIGPGTRDLLSGYRAFSRDSARRSTLRSTGFEIETELASEAVARRMRVVEVSVPYHPRIAGTVSKLRAFRDGRRILMTIVKQGIRLRPVRLLLMVVLPLIVLGVTVHWGFAAAAGLYALVLWSLYLIQLRSTRPRRRNGSRSRREEGTTKNTKLHEKRRNGGPRW